MLCHPPLETPTLDFLQAACGSCTRCDLHKTRHNVVFSRGQHLGSAMIVGEAPGADEDLTGMPFVGKSGQLLDRMFQSIGLDTNKNFYVTNTIKCRPPNNRPPTHMEMLKCMDYLENQILNMCPRFIVAVGNSALEWFSCEKGITKKRGKWFNYQIGNITFPVIAIYHPSYLLRNQHKKDEPNSAWRQTRADLKAIQTAFNHRRFEDAGDPI